LKAKCNGRIELITNRKPSTIESTAFDPAAQFSSFYPHDMPSCQSYLQVSHSVFKSAQLGSQTELPLVKQFGMDENTQYQADGQYSPKHLMQMNNIFPPGGSSRFSQNDSWCSSFARSSVAQPMGNTGMGMNADVKMNVPLPHRNPSYEMTNMHDGSARFNKNSMSQSMDRRGSFFEKWQSERSVSTFSCKVQLIIILTSMNTAFAFVLY
jgi:hypothetical protein